eukprot:CAMPEP_0169458686 /NCGR_PEP_ID=MMETSP1042-20121227/17566_1 /TAXON_ID=464988 /ORGANISM="Hemiselmis andersenii, Strain CCMP1180" /LENGTH=209 /DNA_ID=CAMNT_0009571087 /DNA_START=631 /DNA_END=1261 /DNA_ORIENTATION=+
MSAPPINSLFTIHLGDGWPLGKVFDGIAEARVLVFVEAIDAFIVYTRSVEYAYRRLGEPALGELPSALLKKHHAVLLDDPLDFARCIVLSHPFGKANALLCPLYVLGLQPPLLNLPRVAGGGGAGHVDTLLDPGFCCSFKVVLGGLIPYLNLCSIALISTKDLQVVVDRDADLAGHAHEHEVAVPVKARNTPALSQSGGRVVMGCPDAA